MKDQELTDLEMVRKHVTELGEHFDTVQIFCTRHDEGGEGGTVNVALGSGNRFAILGHVEHWLIREKETSKEAWEEEE